MTKNAPDHPSQPTRLLFASLLVAGCFALLPSTTSAQVTVISRSTTPPGTANAATFFVRWSAGGRYGVVVSEADDLVAGQTPLVTTEAHAYLFDRETGQLQLIDHVPGSAVTAADGAIRSENDVAVSADGEWVAFSSRATNLVAGQVTAADHSIFLWNRTTDSSLLASHAAGSASTTGNDGSLRPEISADGRFVAFESLASDLEGATTDTNAATDVFLFDRLGTTRLVSHSSAPSATVTASDHSTRASVSGDGRFVVFQTAATDLLAGVDDLNAQDDVYLWDRDAPPVSSLTLLSRTAGGPTTGNGVSVGQRLSTDGSTVVFLSAATDLEGVSIDHNGAGLDVFRYDVAGDVVELVSRRRGTTTQTGDGQAVTRPAISADGSVIAFTSVATDHFFGQVDTVGSFDTFLAGSTIRLISHVAGSFNTAAGQSSPSNGSEISADGRFVAFSSAAGDLVAGQGPTTVPNVFLWDATTGGSRLVSHHRDDPLVPANDVSFLDSIAANGSVVGFDSAATDLVDDDQNDETDTFYFAVQGVIFADGFESGDTSAWSVVVP